MKFNLESSDIYLLIFGAMLGIIVFYYLKQISTVLVIPTNISINKNNDYNFI
jgi:hypothetical protein